MNWLWLSLIAVPWYRVIGDSMRDYGDGGLSLCECVDDAAPKYRCGVIRYDSLWGGGLENTLLRHRVFSVRNWLSSRKRAYWFTSVDGETTTTHHGSRYDHHPIV